MKNSIVAMVIATGIGSGASASTNVIINGGFDDTVSGWTGTYGQRSSDPVIDTGPYLFFGQSAFYSISQDYVLSGAERAALPSGLEYTLSGDLFSWRSQNDVATVTVDFLDAALLVLGSDFISNTMNYDGSWSSTLTAGSAETFLTTTGLVPTGTLSVRIGVQAQRTAGSNNDAYADNLSLTLSPIAAVPLPASAALLLTAVGATAAARRRR